MHKINPVLSGRWRTFLREVDAQLPAPVELHCFGGFVLAVCYGLPRPTGDVDYITAIPHAASASIEALAGEGSELAKKHRLHFQRVTIADVPEDYDQRLVRIFAGDFTKLRLLAFEAHDIVLSKLSRNHPKDLEDVQFLTKAGWLDPAILRQRYRKELRPSLANERRHDLTLELWLEACFGRR
jgi:uncharacterized nucleotidyltransferase DUF6036